MSQKGNRCTRTLRVCDVFLCGHLSVVTEDCRDLLAEYSVPSEGC